jgi:hypothetical protein
MSACADLRLASWLRRAAAYRWPHAHQQVAFADLLPLLHRQVDDLTGDLGADLHLHYRLQLAAAGHQFGEVAPLGFLGGHRHRLLAVAARADQGGGRKQGEDVAMRHLERRETVRLRVPGGHGAGTRSCHHASDLSQIGHGIPDISGTHGLNHRPNTPCWGIFRAEKGTMD